MLGNGLRQDYMGRYISQDWLKIKQLVAVLRLWFCGKNHFVVLHLNCVFVQDHGLWHQTDPKKHVFCVFNSAESALNLYYKAWEKVDRCLLSGKLWALFRLVLPRWSWNESTNEESAVVLLAELFKKKKKT